MERSRYVMAMVFLTIFLLSSAKAMIAFGRRGNNMTITTACLENVMSIIFQNLNKGAFKSKLKSKFESFKGSFDEHKIGYCLNRFVESELDFESPGSRGIGRIPSEVPRLGSYFRDRLSKLNKEDTDNLRTLVQDILLSSYLTGVLLLSEDLRKPAVTNPKDLYEAWIPNIYATPFEKLGPGLQDALNIFCSPFGERLDSFMEEHKMLNSRTHQKYTEIISYYVVAGCGLRIEEIGGLY
jgi:hypothetical protein